MDNLLNGQTACLTSKHFKQKAVSKPFKLLIGLEVEESREVDTDCLGTFSGEVERPGPPSEVVLIKARLGAERRGMRFGLATEGSFAPHPRIPFVSSHLELIGFVDLGTSATLTERHVATHTNFAVQDLSPTEDTMPFLRGIQFPSHAVMVRPANAKSSTVGRVFKGIQDFDDLRRAISQSAADSTDGKARIETDMRAHLNPTRQITIRIAARKLARRLSALCPRCSYPGWGLVRNIGGLDCEECGMPTRWIKSLIFGCALCQHEIVRPRTDGRDSAPAGICEVCNP